MKPIFFQVYLIGRDYLPSFYNLSFEYRLEKVLVSLDLNCFRLNISCVEDGHISGAIGHVSENSI